jgi:hypothetical protein
MKGASKGAVTKRVEVIETNRAEGEDVADPDQGRMRRSVEKSGDERTEVIETNRVEGERGRTGRR